MILITKRNELDITTELIISWLYSFNANYTLFNLDNPKKYFTLKANISCLKIESEEKLDIKSVWYWRASPQINRVGNEQLDRYLQRESQTIIEYLLGGIHKECEWFPKKGKISVNKLSVLKIACDVGLLIPKTIITNSKNDLINFFSENEKIITKPINEVDSWDLEDGSFTLFTEEIRKNNLENIPEEFFPTLFQEKIDKVFEIRTFYLDDSFYSMVIFSQDNKKTEIDFRRYDTENENRVSVFKLPESIEFKISQLMKSIEMKSGSIDLIYNGKNEYYFLEVNPVGQIDMVSSPCNYYIEKDIAKKMISYE